MDCPKDYLSGAPPSVGAERTENFEKSRLLRQLEMAFPRLLSTTKAVVILSFRLQYFFHLKQKKWANCKMKWFDIKGLLWHIFVYFNADQQVRRRSPLFGWLPTHKKLPANSATP